MFIPRSYFEMRDIPLAAGQEWTTLREAATTLVTPPPEGVVRLQNWVGVVTAAVETRHRAAVETLNWLNGYESGLTIDALWHDGQPLGTMLVIDQRIDALQQSVWHIHPDLIIALGLVKEGESWLRPAEEWVEVIRTTFDEQGLPRKTEIRTEFLLDYLSARDMGLYVVSFQDRIIVSDEDPGFGLPEDGWHETSGNDKRYIRSGPAEWPDPETGTWTSGELSRCEWIENNNHSPRVRGDGGG